MVTSYNSPTRLRKRRQAALARREADVEKLTNEDKAGNAVGKKLDKAREDVVSLYSKLGLKKKEI